MERTNKKMLLGLLALPSAPAVPDMDAINAAMAQFTMCHARVEARANVDYLGGESKLAADQGTVRPAARA